MMRASIQTTNPDGVLMTLSITMTVKEWNDLREQLSERYPSWQLSGLIGELTRKASVHINATDQASP